MQHIAIGSFNPKSSKNHENWRISHYTKGTECPGMEGGCRAWHQSTCKKAGDKAKSHGYAIISQRERKATTEATIQRSSTQVGTGHNIEMPLCPILHVIGKCKIPGHKQNLRWILAIWHEANLKYKRNRLFLEPPNLTELNQTDEKWRFVWMYM